MRILFLTDNFPPEGNAPATRTYEHATRWIKLGHQVTVITTAPNFPEGKVFEGYKNYWYHRSQLDGIDVVRVKTYITANEGFVKRILDYISFMVTSIFAGLFQQKPDAIVATSPQFFTAISGWVLSAIRRAPFVFELRDIWPASIKAVGAMDDSLVIKILERLELFLYRRADLIISVTNSFKDELVNRGIDSRKITVILNGVDLDKYSPVQKKDIELSKKYGLQNKFVIGYLGTHGLAHALEKIVDAAELLKRRNEIVFLFVGGGAARRKLEDYVEYKRLDNVLMIERQPKEMMPRLWSLCDVSLVHLKESELFKTVIPSKIFESMGMGIPIIISTPEGEATEIISSTTSGLVLPPECPEELAEAIALLVDDQDLFQKFKANSFSASRLYSRANLAEDMIKSIERVLH